MASNYIDKEQESVNKTFKGEKAKLATMSMSEKLGYIWAYYKIHILVILMILGVIGWGVHHALTYVQYKVYCMVINSSQYNEEVAENMHDLLGMDKHDGFNISSDLYTDDNVNMGGYGNQLDIFIMAGQLDYAFTDQAGVEHLVDMGAVMDLKDTLPNELYTKWQDEGLIYDMDVTDDAGVTANYDVAVDISGSPIHEYFGLDDNTKYLVIADLNGSEEYMQNLYKLLLDIENGTVKGE